MNHVVSAPKGYLGKTFTGLCYLVLYSIAIICEVLIFMGVSWLVLFGPYNRTFEKKEAIVIFFCFHWMDKLAMYEPCSAPEGYLDKTFTGLCYLV